MKLFVVEGVGVCVCVWVGVCVKLLAEDWVVEGVLLGVLVDDDEVTNGAVVCV